MKRRIGFYSALLAAILLLMACASLEKNDAVQAGSGRSEALNDKTPTPDTQSALSPSKSNPDTQSALSPSKPNPDTQGALSPSKPNPAPGPEAQNTENPVVTYLITTKNGCNVRSEPREKSKLITTLKKGKYSKRLVSGRIGIISCCLQGKRGGFIKIWLKIRTNFRFFLKKGTQNGDPRLLPWWATMTIYTAALPM